MLHVEIISNIKFISTLLYSMSIKMNEMQKWQSHRNMAEEGKDPSLNKNGEKH